MHVLSDRVVVIFPEMVDAIRCIRAQGIKTALLTNNWLKEPGVGHSPVDKSLFDVVSDYKKMLLDVNVYRAIWCYQYFDWVYSSFLCCNFNALTTHPHVR